MGGFFLLFARVAAIVAGALALGVRPSTSWVETQYANGIYPAWEHAIFPLTNALPWSLGDIAAVGGMACIVARIVVWLRRTRTTVRRRVALAAFDVFAIAGAYAVWFEASWGWNYTRAPIEARTAYDPGRVTTAAVDGLRRVAIARMNALAPLAHENAKNGFDLTQLHAAWLPIVQAGGDAWTPLTGAPKPTVADPFMAMSGTSGFINPLTLNVQLASDLLWFERPFSLSHEWSHVAAYAREDEANYIAIVTCLRSSDPVVQYSGWLELFLYLPPLDRYSHHMFVPQVWQDFADIRRRNTRRVNVSLARFSWRTYNAYLKSNHIAAGIANYNEVTRLYLGIPRDADGVPVHIILRKT